MIQGIPSHLYFTWRREITPFLENFASRDLDGFTAKDFEADILERDRQVWSISHFQALALTCLTPQAVRITHCAGVRRHEWQEAYDAEMRAWAKALGKQRVIGTVRPGWSRFGKAQGYREVHREMALELH
jgi:hypothetical protein